MRIARRAMKIVSYESALPTCNTEECNDDGQNRQLLRDRHASSSSNRKFKSEQAAQASTLEVCVLALSSKQKARS